MQPVNNPPKEGDVAAVFSPSLILKWFETFVKIFGPSALTVTLLYYFGWVRTRALYAAFGIDQSLLQFSTQDYLLRSTQISLGALSMFLTVLLALLWIHYGLTRMRARESPWFARSVLLICLAGLVLIVTSYVWPHDLVGNQAVSILIPLFWTAGVGMTLYGLSLYAGTKTVRDSKGNETHLIQTLPPWLCNWSIGLACALMLVGTFSVVSIAANMEGRARAAAIMADPGIQPEIVVFSKIPLMLQSPDIIVEQIGDDTETFRYKYSGLYLLVRSGDKYFLIPGSWTSGKFYSVILTESDGIRIEVSSGISKDAAADD
ncbi:MAG: hypothetical protein AB1649_12715 [Chloroflexota bacterium]